MPISLHILAASLFLCLTPLVSQGRVLVVGGTYSSIQAAVDAAAHDDIVLVPNTATWGPATISKGLTLVLQNAPLVATTNTLGSALRIERLPAGRVCRITGILRTQETGGSPSVSVDRCAGTVVFDRFEIRHTFVRVRPSLDIAASSAVILTASILTTGVVSTASNVEAVLCDLQGAGQTAVLTGALAAVTAQGGTVGITHCQLIGGAGLAVQGSPGSGLRLLQGASARVRGDLGGIVAGANAPTPAIDGSGQLQIDPSVTLTPTNGAPAIGPGITSQAIALPALSIFGAPRGGVLRYDVQSAVGDSAIAVLARPGAPFQIPGVGEVWLDLSAGFVVLPLGTVPGTGHLPGSIGIPADPLLLGVTFGWQVATAGAATGLSNPGAYVHD